ncbi:Gfo/Idh/MocA family protein [Paenibacillus rhizoplanae]
MWKVGVVGAGYWSDKHLQAWQRIPGVQIHGLCDLDSDRLHRKAEAYGIPGDMLYSTLEDMLSSAELDIVDIITAPDTHPELVGLAARAGKHIMCQKPFARSMEEAREMVETARAAGVRLMVTENWRWLQPIQAIRKLLDQGAAGRLQTIRYIHTDYYSPRFAPENELPQPFFSGRCRSCCFMRWGSTGMIRGASCSGSLSGCMQRPGRSARLLPERTPG